MSDLEDEYPLPSALYPEAGYAILSGTGRDLLKRLGSETVRETVARVLEGENLRDLTEPLTRRRLIQANAAMLIGMTKGFLMIPDFTSIGPLLAAIELRNRPRGAAQRSWPSQWLLGLTTKSVQNVLRGRSEVRIARYVQDFQDAVQSSAKICEAEYGPMRVVLRTKHDGVEKDHELDWTGLSMLLTAIGAQTLTVRGSEKSTYGKLFERLVLGSVLTVLGLQRASPKDATKRSQVFWLSDSSESRESDATAILRPGVVARFDIGFIGAGNPEITKDKLSRFERALELRGESHSSTTFVIIDKVPQSAKTLAQAKVAGAHIIQMSMKLWPIELARALEVTCGYKSPISTIAEGKLGGRIRAVLAGQDVSQFAGSIQLPSEIDSVVG